MKKILLTFLISFPLISHGQSIESDKVDQFNGNRDIKTKFVSLNGDFKIQLAAIASKTDTTFAMNFYFPTDVTSVDDRSGVAFKLSDSSVLDFPYLGDYELCSRHRLCNIYIALNRNDLENFLNGRVLIIRIKTSSKVLDFDIKEKQAQKINALINLLLEQL
ncbi:MAG TPA: hypothetical protein VFF23_12930 [Hanamia sp.]|nr:hypothetical protein [Hanamia sp.]